MPRDPASPSAAQMIVADPEGDIVFMVGRKKSDQKSILVSSKVLSLASPAFAALFSPRWSEGVDKFSSIKPRQIDLPDDDTAAMDWICQALHFRSNISTDIGLSRLEKVAILGDKYDLGVALKPWGQLCLQSLRWTVSTDLSEAEIVSLMWVVFFFDHSRLFWYSSFALQFRYSRSSSSRDGQHISGIAASLLKEKTIVSIIADRHNILNHVHTMLEDMITQVLSDTEGPIAITHHIKELQRIDLWPLSKIFQQASLKDVEQRLGFYQACKWYDCGCSRVKMHDTIKVILGVIAEKQAGLCLKCYKVGKVSRASENCMMLDQRLCESGEIDRDRFLRNLIMRELQKT
ncbi:hypothetical protein N7G274_009870 [Stereocaulon virgatum]|uniref:BTB domain-containing protein n=1 Tax=Stereocaulon virgatum TaxID=373712 RepID=A0ABR3ZUV3_9LECA